MSIICEEGGQEPTQRVGHNKVLHLGWFFRLVQYLRVRSKPGLVKEHLHSDGSKPYKLDKTRQGHALAHLAMSVKKKIDFITLSPGPFQ
jgi:hypothetical protein